MTATDHSPVTFLSIGPLLAEYHLLPGGRNRLGQLGGSAVYAATGMRIWTKEKIGIVSRIGVNFSPAHQIEMEQSDFRLEGIRIIPGNHALAHFLAYDDWNHVLEQEPRIHFHRRNLPLPKELDAYQSPFEGYDTFDAAPDIAIRPQDIPPAFTQAPFVYIGPCHPFSQLLLTVSLKEHSVQNILLAPPSDVFHPSKSKILRTILHGIPMVFAKEEDALIHCANESATVSDAAETLAQIGADLILLQCGLDRIHIFESASKRHQEFPALPVSAFDITGFGDAFCGGFLAGWQTTFDPIESALRGLVSASIIIESTGVLGALTRTPGLSSIRMQSLRNARGNITNLW